MAINANNANRKVLQNIRTTKTNTQIEGMLSATTALGELAVQLGSGATDLDSKKGTSLWTLAANGETAVRFPSYEAVLDMITGGASIYLDNVIDAVGLQKSGDDKGDLPSSWGTGATYYTSGDTIVSAIENIDAALDDVSDDVEALSGAVESFSADVKTYIDSVSGDIETTIIALSGNVVNYVQSVSGDIESTIIALSGDVENKINEVSGNIETTILAMNKDADAQVGKIVTTVSETDGVVSETKAYLTDIQLSGYTNDGETYTGAIADGDTVEVALNKLENNIAAAQEATTVASADKSINVTTGTTGTDINVNIKSGEHVLAKDGNAGLYTNIKISAVTPTETNVKEEYVLYGTDNTVLGDHIKVYKDANLVEAYLGHVDDTLPSSSSSAHTSGTGDTALCFVYQLADGTYQLVAVDVSKFLEETEFKSGVTATDHIVHGVVDSASEKDSQETPSDFLTVGADGFKVSGIKDEIDRKINALDAGVSDTSSDNHVEVRVAETDGKLTSVEVLTSDIASEDALEELSGSVIELSGVVESIVEGFDSSVTGTSEDGRVEIVVAQADGTLSGATVTLSDVASASALTELSGSVIDEIARAKSAETALDGVVGSTKGANDETRTYGHSGTNYLNASTSVKTDTEALDDIIGKVVNDPAGDYDVEFSDTNTVAKNISDIKKALDDYKQALTLTAVDDNKYIATEVVSGDTGTTIGVSAITHDIATSTSAATGLADAYDVKEFAISAVKDDSTNGGLTRIQVVTEDDVKKLDVSNLTVDCGEF